MLFHRANAQVQNYLKYSFLHRIMPAFCRTWAQSDFFAVTSLILGSQYMHIERIVLAYIGLNHKKLPLFVLQKPSTAADFYDSPLYVSHFHDGMKTGKERELLFIVMEEFVIIKERETHKWNDQTLSKNSGEDRFFIGSAIFRGI